MADNQRVGRRTAAVIRPAIEPGCRVLAVSDVHGNLPFFKGALEAAGFSRRDVLVIVGDLLEKGAESLSLLRYVMELSGTHRVYALSGNCDHIDRVFLEGRPGADRELWPVFRFWGERSLVLQMGAELGLRPGGEEDLPALRQAIWERLPREAEFLCSMPHILETDNYIFVHGGISREHDLEGLDAYSCMKNDDFLGQGLTFRKWVVVGHWPVTLYDPRIPMARPLWERERHIVSIDGGCVLKADGQLNVLVIPDVSKDGMEWVAYDGLPLVTALEDQVPSADPINVRWSDSAVEVLREEGDCTLCRHISSGRELWILSDYLYPRRADGYIHCEDSTDYCLPVTAGDTLSLVRRCSRGCLVKKAGVTGWYMGPVEEGAGGKN